MATEFSRAFFEENRIVKADLRAAHQLREEDIARCQRCGRMLPVGYPFKICDPCFRHSSIID